MTKYTITVIADEEAKFKRIMERLEPEEYTVLEELHPIKEDDVRTCDRQTIIEMDPEAALTFRLGMRYVKIRRERTEEELAEEKRLDDMNTVRITVKVDGMNADGSFTVDDATKGSLLDANILAEKLEGIQLK